MDDFENLMTSDPRSSTHTLGASIPLQRIFKLLFLSTRFRLPSFNRYPTMPPSEGARKRDRDAEAIARSAKRSERQVSIMTALLLQVWKFNLPSDPLQGQSQKIPSGTTGIRLQDMYESQHRMLCSKNGQIPHWQTGRALFMLPPKDLFFHGWV